MRRVSDGVADEEYCEKLRQEAPVSARYLQDRGVEFVHHDEPNVLLEFDTDQHFVFPNGGGNAIIQKVFEHIRKFDNCDIHYETEAIRLLTDDAGAIRGLKVRKNDGLLHDLLAPNVVLACGGFEGNQEMLARYIGRDSHKLPLIAPGLKCKSAVTERPSTSQTLTDDLGFQTTAVQAFAWPSKSAPALQVPSTACM